MKLVSLCVTACLVYLTEQAYVPNLTSSTLTLSASSTCETGEGTWALYDIGVGYTGTDTTTSTGSVFYLEDIQPNNDFYIIYTTVTTEGDTLSSSMLYITDEDARDNHILFYTSVNIKGDCEGLSFEDSSVLNISGFDDSGGLGSTGVSTLGGAIDFNTEQDLHQYGAYYSTFLDEDGNDFVPLSFFEEMNLGQRYVIDNSCCCQATQPVFLR